MRALIYCRTSGQDQDRDSLSKQERACREYCEKQGYTVVYVLKEDVRGISGKRMDAPEFLKAKDLAKNGAYDVFVCRELQRLARKAFKHGAFKFAMSQYGVSVEYVKQSFEDNKYGRFTEGTMALVSELNAEIIAERLYDGRVDNVRNGNVVACGRTPYGLTAAEKDGKTTLVDNGYGHVVKTIFEMYAKGYSVRAIAQHLTDTKKPTWYDVHVANGGTPSKKRKSKPYSWKRQPVTKIISSEVYSGIWTMYGQTIHIEPLISQDLWQAAQDRRKKKPKARKKTSYLLTGMLTCGLCGASVGGHTQKRESGSYRYYVCRSKKKPLDYGHKCTLKSVRCDDLEKFVFSVFWDWMKNPDDLKQIVNEQINARIEQQAEQREQAEMMDAYTAKLREQLTDQLRLYSDVNLGEISKNQILAQIKTLEKQITESEQEKTRLATSLDDIPDPQEIIERLRYILREMGRQTVFAQVLERNGNIASYVQHSGKTLDEYLGRDKTEDIPSEELAELFRTNVRNFLLEIGTKITIHSDDTITLDCLLGETGFSLSQLPTSGYAQKGERIKFSVRLAMNG